MIAAKIEELSRDIWKNLHNASLYNINYGEETITDYILLELAKQNYYQLKIIQTTKPKESVQGTDWDWFIGSHEFGWIRYSIQAKKHYFKTDYYSIKYQVGKAPHKRYQYDILRQYSMLNNSVPLYCFYNYFPTLRKSNHWHCGESFDSELLGWTFTTLRNIEAIASLYSKKDFNSIHRQKEALPMRCLFKCRYFQDKYLNKDYDNKQEFLGERFNKIKSMPSSLITAAEIGTLYEFPKDLFNPELNIYPKRIAIFDISNILYY